MWLWQQIIVFKDAQQSPRYICKYVSELLPLFIWWQVELQIWTRSHSSSVVEWHWLDPLSGVSHDSLWHSNHARYTKKQNKITNLFFWCGVSVHLLKNGCSNIIIIFQSLPVRIIKYFRLFYVQIVSKSCSSEQWAIETNICNTTTVKQSEQTINIHRKSCLTFSCTAQS